MGDSISERLQLVDLENNQITKFILGYGSYKKTLKWEHIYKLVILSKIVIVFCLSYSLFVYHFYFFLSGMLV